MSTPTPTSTGRSGAQTALIALGFLVLVGGLACVVVGLLTFVGTQDDFGGGGDSSGVGFTLFVLGGLGMVIGLGIVAFTRARALTRNGAYSRVTIEQGVRPVGGRFCSGCGRPVEAGARFCESCGTAVA